MSKTYASTTPPAGDGFLTLYHIDYHAAADSLRVTGTDPKKMPSEGGAVYARTGGAVTEQTFHVRVPASAVMHPTDWVWNPAERPFLLDRIRKAFPLDKEFFPAGKKFRLEREIAIGLLASCLQWPRLHWCRCADGTRQEWRERAERFLCQWAEELDRGFQAVETGPGLYVLLPGLTLSRCLPETK